MTEAETPPSVPLPAPSGSEPVQRAPEDRVPADQRIFGIDRRTIWPGVVLLVVFLLWSQAMPWIDDQIELDNPIVAGDVINLGNGEVTFVPAVGWDLLSGTLLVEGDTTTSVPTSATLLSDTVSYSAKSGNWDGTAEELLDQVIDVNESLDDLGVKDEQDRISITNADGVPGELAYLVGVDQAALIATFVFEPEGGGTKIGVEIEVRGEPAQLEGVGRGVRPDDRFHDLSACRPGGELMTDTASRTVDDSVVTARRAVIDESGWAAPFRFIQVHNFTFWVVVLLFVSGASQTYQGFSASAQAYTDSFAQGTVWFGLFAVLFLWLFSRLDRYSSIPAKAKVVAFLFSGLVSTFAMAAINNDAFRSILAKVVSLEFMQVWSAGATAPWSEEIVKLLPVVLMIGLAPRAMRCAFDGLIIGAISGLAFQVFEDVSYVYGSAAANFGQAAYGTQTLFTRTIARHDRALDLVGSVWSRADLPHRPPGGEAAPPFRCRPDPVGDVPALDVGLDRWYDWRRQLGDRSLRPALDRQPGGVHLDLPQDGGQGAYVGAGTPRG